MSDLVLPALDFVPFGAPVVEAEGGCRVTADLRTMTGIARRPWGNAGIGAAAGETVAIARDGGILAALAQDADVEVRGVTVRLLAVDRHYLQLQSGRIVACREGGR